MTNSPHHDPLDVLLREHFQAMPLTGDSTDGFTEALVNAALTRRRRRAAATWASMGVAAALLIGTGWGIGPQLFDGKDKSAPRPASRPPAHTLIFEVNVPTSGDGLIVAQDERSQPAVDCSSATPSRFATSAGSMRCGSSADNAYACFKVTGANELICVTDPFARKLTLMRATSIPTTDKPANAVPLGLQLDDGSLWVHRVAGTADILAPPAGTVQTYTCYAANPHCKGQVAGLLSPENGPELAVGPGEATVTVATAASPGAPPSTTEHRVAAVWYVSADGR